MTSSIEKVIHITSSGAVIKRVDQNHIHINFNNIKSVGLNNIMDIECHTINTIYNSRSHLIKFRNGGEVTFAYNDKGQLVDLRAIGVNLLLNSSNELVFSISPICTPPSPKILI